MKQPLEDKIFNNILDEINTAIVGPACEGKTFFVVNKLIPFLENEGFTVQYFPESEAPIEIKKETTVVIFDEVETFLDQDFLEVRYPEDKPYYYDSYIKRYSDFYKEIQTLDIPAIFIVTRNERVEIQNLVNNYYELDNGIKVKYVEFKKGKKVKNER